jgi:hypothetical protein
MYDELAHLVFFFAIFSIYGSCLVLAIWFKLSTVGHQEAHFCIVSLVAVSNM